MKIAVYHNLPSGGAIRVLASYVRDLYKLGHEITVFSTTDSELFQSETRNLVSEFRLYKFKPIINFGYHTVILSPLAGFELYRLHKMGKTIAQDIDNGDFDVVFVNPDRFTQSPLLLKYLKTPSVYLAHELFRGIHEKLPGMGSIFNMVLRFFSYRFYFLKYLEKTCMKSATEILVNSNFSQKVLLETYGLKSIVCRMGIDHDYFKPDEREKESIILNVGQLSPLKNQEFIIRALSGIKIETEFTLIFVYDQESRKYRQYLKKLAQESGLKIMWKKKIPDENLIDLYRKSRVLAFAAIREPFGLVALEAMACGLPVVAVDGGGVAESVVHNKSGYLTAANEHDFSRAVLKILLDDKLGRQMGECARKNVIEYWGWDSSVSFLEKQLKKVL